MNCNKCGAELRDGSMFCSQCGCKVNHNTDEQSSAVSVSARPEEDGPQPNNMSHESSAEYTSVSSPEDNLPIESATDAENKSMEAGKEYKKLLTGLSLIRSNKMLLTLCVVILIIIIAAIANFTGNTKRRVYTDDKSAAASSITSDKNASATPDAPVVKYALNLRTSGDVNGLIINGDAASYIQLLNKLIIEQHPIPTGIAATDEQYKYCFISVVKNLLKNPSAARFNSIEVLEKDSYHRAIVLADVSAENGFGGYDRTCYMGIIEITDVDKDGTINYYRTIPQSYEKEAFGGYNDENYLKRIKEGPIWNTDSAETAVSSLLYDVENIEKNRNVYSAKGGVGSIIEIVESTVDKGILSAYVAISVKKYEALSEDEAKDFSSIVAGLFAAPKGVTHVDASDKSLARSIISHALDQSQSNTQRGHIEHYDKGLAYGYRNGDGNLTIFVLPISIENYEAGQIFLPWEDESASQPTSSANMSATPPVDITLMNTIAKHMQTQLRSAFPDTSVEYSPAADTFFAYITPENIDVIFNYAMYGDEDATELWAHYEKILSELSIELSKDSYSPGLGKLSVCLSLVDNDNVLLSVENGHVTYDLMNAG